MDIKQLRDLERVSTHIKYTRIPRQKKKINVHSIIWMLLVVLTIIGFNSELPLFLENNFQYLTIALVLYTFYALFLINKLRIYKKQQKEYELLIKSQK